MENTPQDFKEGNGPMRLVQLLQIMDSTLEATDSALETLDSILVTTLEIMTSTMGL